MSAISETIRARFRARRAGFAATAFIAAASVLSLTAPFKQGLPAIVWLFPAVTITLVLLAVLNAALLIVRSMIRSEMQTLILGCTYLFVGVMILGQAYTLPTAPRSGFTMPANEASIWFWVLWRAGAAVGTFAYACTMRRRAKDAAPVDSTAFAPVHLISAAAIGIGLCIAGFMVAMNASGTLPTLIVGTVRQPQFHVITVAVIALNAVAAVLLMRTPPTDGGLPVWMRYATIFTICDILLVLHAAAPFTLGWYTGRTFTLTSMLVLFVPLVTEVSQHVGRIRELRNERVFRDLAEALPQMIWTSNAEGANDWYNRRWYAYTGLSPAESLGWEWSAAHHPADLPAVLLQWPDAVAHGRPFEMEYRLRGADGAYRWFLARATPVFDTAGRLMRWYTSCTDIDDQRKQSDALSVLLAQERRVVETLHDLLVPGIRLEVPFAHFDSVYRAATDETRVGGDWFDVFAFPDGRIAVSIGDVTGHGLDAAASMVRAREMLRAVSTLNPSQPEIALSRVNTLLCESSEQDLVTAIFGILDDDGRRFTYSIAGHPPPMLIRESGVQTLESGGLPLGLESGTIFPNYAVSIDAGETIALFTDGLLEATANVIEGEANLHRALAAHPHDAEAVADAILTETQRDDVALLLVTVLESAVPPIEERSPTGWSFACEDAGSAQSARGSFVAYLRSRGANENDIAAAEIVLGELIGNVLRHAPGPIEIALSWAQERPVLRVLDRGAGFHPRAVPAADDLFAESGRGMFLISAFADPPDVRRRPGGGTEVVVRLPFQGAAALAGMTP